MNLKHFEYICKYMLHIEPDIWGHTSYADQRAVLSVLDLCQSKLEVMYLIGAMRHYDEMWKRHVGYGGWFSAAQIPYNGKNYRGIWFSEPWFCWYLDEFEHGWGGPSAISFVPQLPFGNGLHHDFGVFTSNDNGDPGDALEFALEIDGYAVHKSRREKDAWRDSQATYPVLRLREETSSPLTWFRQWIVDSYVPFFNDVPPTNSEVDNAEF